MYPENSLNVCINWTLFNMEAETCINTRLHRLFHDSGCLNAYRKDGVKEALDFYRNFHHSKSLQEKKKKKSKKLSPELTLIKARNYAILSYGDVDGHCEHAVFYVTPVCSVTLRGVATAQR